MKSYSEVIIDQGKETANIKFLKTGIDSFDEKYEGLSPGINLFCGFHGIGLTMLASLITGNVSRGIKCLYITLDNPSRNITERIELYSNYDGRNIYLNEMIYSAAKILKFLTNEVSKFPLIVIDTFQLIEFDISYQSFVRQLQELSLENDSSIMQLYSLRYKYDYTGGYIEPSIDFLNPHYYLKFQCSTVYGLNRPSYFGINEDELGNNIEGLVIIKNLKELEIRESPYKFAV